jgi:lycopene cyclase domain-containing protein
MPLGEYLFVVCQSVLVGVWTFRRDGAVDPTIGHSWRDRLVGVLAGVAVGVVGLAFLLGPGSTFYLGAILAWAAPVLALQWGVGWRYLVAVRRRIAVMLAVPVLYLSTIDRYAIEQGLWTISPQYSTGLTVGGLPVEEGVFFLCTSLFVVQALVLLRWVIARWG